MKLFGILIALACAAVHASPTGEGQLSRWPENGDATPEDEILIQHLVTGLHDIHSSLQPGCVKCKAKLAIGKALALTRPDLVPEVYTQWCLEEGGSMAHCHSRYGLQGEPPGMGEEFTRLLQLMNPQGLDGDLYCYYHDQKCTTFPDPPSVDLRGWFPPKRHSLTATLKPQGETFNVLHLSDLNLHLHYQLAAESNCTGIACCGPESRNVNAPPLDYNYFDRHPSAKGLSFYASTYSTGSFAKGPYLDLHRVYQRNRVVWLPGHEFGAYRCHSPELLLNNTFREIQRFHLEDQPFEFALLTGGMAVSVSDENVDAMADSQLRVLGDYHHYLGDIPLIGALGKGDTLPLGQLAQRSSGRSYTNHASLDELADRFYEHGWLSMNEKRKLRDTYFGYATTTKRGLKVISLNSNIWFTGNLYNFWNTTAIDAFGHFRFLADELEQSEKANQRVWIVASIPTNKEALPLPAKMFAAIVERFSPATIAGVFLGHTGKDQFQILYAGGGQEARTMETALNMAWLGPSVSPAGGVNPAWRYYTVDTETFQIMNSYTFYTPLDVTFDNHGQEPGWELEYSAREAYDPEGQWPVEAPLNAAFWHLVAERLKTERSEATAAQYVSYQYRLSPFIPIADPEAEYCDAVSFTPTENLACRGVDEEEE